MSEKGRVSELIDSVDGHTGDGDVPVGDLFDGLGQVAVPTALLMPALLVFSPLSAIPLFSTVCGLCMALIAVQGLFGHRSLWLPGALRRRRLPGPRLHKATQALRWFGRLLDRITQPRLSFLVGSVGKRVIYLVIVFSTLAIPFLELIPMSSTLIGLAVILFSTGILGRDGLIALCGTLPLMAAAILPFTVWQVVNGA